MTPPTSNLHQISDEKLTTSTTMRVRGHGCTRISSYSNNREERLGQTIENAAKLSSRDSLSV